MQNIWLKFGVLSPVYCCTAGSVAIASQGTRSIDYELMKMKFRAVHNSKDAIPKGFVNLDS